MSIDDADFQRFVSMMFNMKIDSYALELLDLKDAHHVDVTLELKNDSLELFENHINRPRALFSGHTHDCPHYQMHPNHRNALLEIVRGAPFTSDNMPIDEFIKVLEDINIKVVEYFKNATVKQ